MIISFPAGKVSYVYRKEMPRPAFVFEQHKTANTAPVFVTMLLPYEGNSTPNIKMTENPGNNYSNGTIDLTVTINNKAYEVKGVL